MKLPDKLNRKAVVANFDKVSPKTWEYLFDYEKETDLKSCRTNGCGAKNIWYSTNLLKIWLIERGHYLPSDFEEKQQRRQNNSWAGLNIKQHEIAA